MQSSDLGRQGQGLGEDKEKAREQSGAPGHKRGPPPCTEQSLGCGGRKWRLGLILR